MDDEQAAHDPLTGLPNRRVFGNRLAAAVVGALLRGHQVALLLINLDRFHAVNATRGHAAGDQVLRVVAARLQADTRPGESVARWNGDGFVLLAAVSGPKDAAHRAQQLLAALAQPVDLDGGPLSLTASIGIALSPIDGTDADGLLRHADRSVYRIKAVGGNGYRW
jgi:diguanylate cyclase (GGDEF)-like protein